MIRPNLKESVIIGIIQFVLWMAYPWQTTTRFETAMCLITLGIVALCLLCLIEWAAGLLGKEVLLDGDAE